MKRIHIMLKLRIPVCLLLLLTASALAEDQVKTIPGGGAAGPVTKGQRVFSCGHSFHFYVPDMLAEIAKAAGYADHQAVGKSMIGGSKVIQHWNVADDKNKARESLTAGTVDVLTLTPIYLPDEGIENFAKLGFQHNPNIRITVQEFWIPYDKNEPHYYDPPKIPAPKVVDHNGATMEKLRAEYEPYFQLVDAQVREVNQKLGKPVLAVVPVGQAVLALREKIIAGKAPGLSVQEDLFTDALGHAKQPLQALVTYCHYAVIYRKSPVGLPAPKALAQDKAVAGHVDELNRLLQEIAWDAVTRHPLSGVRGAPPASH